MKSQILMIKYAKKSQFKYAKFINNTFIPTKTRLHAIFAVKPFVLVR